MLSSISDWRTKVWCINNTNSHKLHQFLEACSQSRVEESSRIFLSPRCFGAEKCALGGGGIASRRRRGLIQILAWSDIVNHARKQPIRPPTHLFTLPLNGEDVSLLLCPGATSVSYFLPSRNKESARLDLVTPDPVSRFVLDLLSLLRRAYLLSLEVGRKALGNRCSLT